MPASETLLPTTQLVQERTIPGADDMEVWNRLLETVDFELPPANTTDTNTLVAEPGPPQNGIILEPGKSVLPLVESPPHLGVLVDEVAQEGPLGGTTTTREQRHANQVTTERLRTRDLIRNHRLRHRTTMAEESQTSSMQGLPELQDGQRYALVAIKGYQPQETPLSHIVVRRGATRPDGIGKVRYLSGRMNPSRVRRQGR